MARLPRLSGRKVIRAFEKLGWQQVRQSGSHAVLVRDGHIATLSVPVHKEVAQGTLRSLIRSAGITVAEFLDVVQSS